MYIFCRQFNFLIAGPYIYIHKLILLIKTCYCSSAEVREKLDLVDTKYDDYCLQNNLFPLSVCPSHPQILVCHTDSMITHLLRWELKKKKQ